MNWHKYFRVISLVWLSVSSVSGQDQRIADSLSVIYEQGTLQGKARMELLLKLSLNENYDFSKAIFYTDELIRLASGTDNPKYLYRAYRQKGEIQLQLGNFDKALEAYFKSLEIAKAAENPIWQGSAMTGIADTYSEMGNSANSSNFYNQAISLLRTTTDTIAVGIAIINAGDEYFKAGKYDSALIYFEESAAIFEQQDYLIGKAYAQGNTGMVQAATGKFERAQTNINEAVTVLEELEDSYAISEYLTSMADSYWEQGEPEKALEYAHRSLEMARQFGIKQQISDTNLKLSDFYEQLGEAEASLLHFKEHMAYRDSVNNLSTVQRMADLRTDYEVSQKQVEVDLLNQQKRNQQIILASVGVLVAILLWFFVAIRKEKKKSDALLLNILPGEIAKELKEKGEVETVRFEEVSVLFTDFVLFSEVAEVLDPKQLVDSVDYYFKQFDGIVAKHGLEKIKTIGDAYMCAGGIPKTNTTHAEDAMKAAIEIRNLLDRTKKNPPPGIHPFEIRIGLNSGPVVAGVVGTQKFAYDIWGSTVNHAARMESKSAPGRINVSETTYQLLKDNYNFTYRGELEVKNGQVLKMYFAEENSRVSA